MDFFDLHLTASYPIQLHVADAEGKKGRYFCRYIGCVKKNAVIVSPLVTGGRDLGIDAGQVVTARLMIGRGICVFPARILAMQQQPVPMLYLEYPGNVEFKSIRNADRVETKLPVIVNNAGKKGQVSEGKLCDISITGARIELYKCVADIGDEIIISGDFLIETISQAMRANAVIHSRVNVPQKQSNIHQPITYGVEFVRLPDDKKLILYGYVNYLLAHTYLPKV